MPRPVRVYQPNLKFISVVARPPYRYREPFPIWLLQTNTTSTDPACVDEVRRQRRRLRELLAVVGDDFSEFSRDQCVSSQELHEPDEEMMALCAHAFDLSAGQCGFTFSNQSFGMNEHLEHLREGAVSESLEHSK